MEKSTPSDPELLAEWLDRQREPAFHALVARYAGLVHATAKRTCGDDSLAAEASQLTFIALAQKAKSLTTCASLGGWLHLTAMMQAKNLTRKSQRENRKRQLLQAAMETGPPHTSNDVWQELQPVLDDALAALSDKDREALLLRFYRSLTIREIAATLGIATDAAQKRIDRATERLRGKLTRRGCQAGGSLGAVMAAGFAADAQAAVPAVSLLASKAIAAGAVGGGAGAGIFSFFTISAMKATSLIPPVVALVLAGAWIGTRRQSISALDRQSDLLAAAISARATTAAADPLPIRLTSAVGQSKGKEVIDWNEVAGQLAKTSSGRFSDIDEMMFNQRLASMSKEEMIAALEEIAGLDISKKIRERMEEMVVFPFRSRFPEFAVTQLTSRFQATGGICAMYLSDAFGEWAKMDLEKAEAWMDQQVSSGMFDTKSLDGKSWTKDSYERALVAVMLSKNDGDGAGRRLDQVPSAQRKDFITGIVAGGSGLSPGEQVGFAQLVRGHIPEAGQAEAFGVEAGQLSENLSDIPGYLERIGATAEERAICLGYAASTNIAHISWNRKVTRQDLVAMREWVDTQMPEAVDRFTGEALGKAGERHINMNFAEASDFAVEFNEAAGNDDVLAAFLTSEAARSNKLQARALAGKISDESRRAEIMKGLE